MTLNAFENNKNVLRVYNDLVYTFSLIQTQIFLFACVFLLLFAFILFVDSDVCRIVVDRCSHSDCVHIV